MVEGGVQKVFGVSGMGTGKVQPKQELIRKEKTSSIIKISRIQHAGATSG